MTTTNSTLALNAVTSTTTSSNICVAGAKRIGFRLTRAAHTSGSSTFTFAVGMDAASSASPTMVTCNMWVDNVTNTNAQTLTRVASKALSSATSVVVWLDPSLVVNWVNVTATTATDGNASAVLLVETEA